jgi:predicted nucleic acid-binding protein
VILLDAYAVIAFLQADPHVGPEVRQLVAPGTGAPQQAAAITTVNAAEVLDHLIRIRRADPDEAVLDLEQLGLHTIVVDEQIGLHAGLLRARHYHARTRQVSLADCIAAAAVLLAPDVDALATADADLLDLIDAEGGRTHPLRASDGSIWTPNREA